MLLILNKFKDVYYVSRKKCVALNELWNFASVFSDLLKTEWTLWGRMAVSPSVVQKSDSCQTLGENYITLGHLYSWAYVCHSSTWKRYLQIEIIASSSKCRPCCFQSVWNMKNVCFLVCIFSTNLQRPSLLKNHRSDLKIIIFKMGGGGGEITLVFICLDFILFLRENFLFARTSSPSLDACAYAHTYRYMQAYPFPSW